MPNGFHSLEPTRICSQSIAHIAVGEVQSPKAKPGHNFWFWRRPKHRPIADENPPDELLSHVIGQRAVHPAA